MRRNMHNAASRANSQLCNVLSAVVLELLRAIFSVRRKYVPCLARNMHL